MIMTNAGHTAPSGKAFVMGNLSEPITYACRMVCAIKKGCITVAYRSACPISIMSGVSPIERPFQDAKHILFRKKRPIKVIMFEDDPDSERLGNARLFHIPSKLFYYNRFTDKTNIPYSMHNTEESKTNKD